MAESKQNTYLEGCFFRLFPTKPSLNPPHQTSESFETQTCPPGSQKYSRCSSQGKSKSHSNTPKSLYSPTYSQDSPTYTPGSPSNTFGFPTHSPGSPTYTPDTPYYTPGTPTYTSSNSWCPSEDESEDSVCDMSYQDILFRVSPLHPATHWTNKQRTRYGIHDQEIGHLSHNSTQMNIC